MKKDTFVQYWVEVGTTSTTMSKALQASHCNKIGGHPANTRHPHDVVLVLAHRVRRWTNIKPATGKYLVFAGQDMGVLLLHQVA